MNSSILQVLISYFTIIISGGLSAGEWRPVGQGDPLIDPTNVYSPPMVEHVHYWLEPRHRPRIDLPGSNKGPPLGFAQAQNYNKYSQHGESGLYGSTTYGPFKEVTIMEQYDSSYSPSLQQNYGFHLRNNPILFPGNHPSSYDSLQSFSSNSAIRIEPHRLSVKDHFSLTPLDEKQIFTQMTSTLPPAGQSDSHPLSLSLQPPPQHAITLGQVAGWPHISTHLHPNNYHSSSLSPAVSSATPTIMTTPIEPITTPSTTTTTTTTTTKAPPTAPPVSLVIEGHSKVKKYGPLPESSNSVHLINHNHLISKKVCEHCLDLPVAKVKEITNPS